jgi:hypothetical protein
MGESARKDDEVEAIEIRFGVPHQFSGRSGELETLDSIVLTVAARKDDNRSGHRASTRTVESSMTGFASKRVAKSVATAVASSAELASTAKTNERPARTLETVEMPSAGRARSIVAPSGSAIPGRKLTSTVAVNLMASHRTSR